MTEKKNWSNFCEVIRERIIIDNHVEKLWKSLITIISQGVSPAIYRGAASGLVNMDVFVCLYYTKRVFEQSP